MKIFLQNQCIIKKLKNFSFFGDEKSSSGIFTLCNKKIIFKWKVKLWKKDSLKNNDLSKILKNIGFNKLKFSSNYKKLSKTNKNVKPLNEVKYERLRSRRRWRYSFQFIESNQAVHPTQVGWSYKACPNPEISLLHSIS